MKEFIKNRYYLHLLVTILIGGGLYPLFMYMNHSVEMGILDKLLMIILAGGVSAALNLGWEWFWDWRTFKKYGYNIYDKKDILWGTIGSLLGAAISCYIWF